MNKYSHITPKCSPTWEPGAILSDSWGYEQTNYDFYCILEVNGQWVKLQPMTKQIVAGAQHMMETKEMPGEIDWSKKPLRRKAWTSGGELSALRIEYGCCKLWKGKPETATHYA